METLCIRVEKSGRILIPVGVRRKLGIKEGETDIMLKVDDTNSIAISTRAQALERAHSVLSKYVKPGRLVSEELIADREAEAGSEFERA